jgi:hypothetical protein
MIQKKEGNLSLDNPSIINQNNQKENNITQLYCWLPPLIDD